MLPGAADEVLHAGAVRDVQLQGVGVLLAELLHELFEPVHPAGPEGDLGPGFHELAGGGPADAGAGSGDGDDGSGEVSQLCAHGVSAFLWA